MADQTSKGAAEDLKPGEPGQVIKPYTDIIQSLVEKPDTTFLRDPGVAAPIVYFCRDCQKLVQGARIGRKLQFGCPVCKGKNVAFGTEKSIISHYRITEEAAAAQKAALKKET